LEPCLCPLVPLFQGTSQNTILAKRVVSVLRYRVYAGSFIIARNVEITVSVFIKPTPFSKIEVSPYPMLTVGLHTAVITSAYDLCAVLYIPQLHPLLHCSTCYLPSFGGRTDPNPSSVSVITCNLPLVDVIRGSEGRLSWRFITVSSHTTWKTSHIDIYGKNSSLQLVCPDSRASQLQSSTLGLDW
jgi:hypothetical protein